jgi:hypothetical protein
MKNNGDGYDYDYDMRTITERKHPPLSHITLKIILRERIQKWVIKKAILILVGGAIIAINHFSANSMK